MSYAPEILVSNSREVLEEFAQPETLVTCWDAENDPEFARAFERVLAFNQSAQNAWDELTPVEAYADAVIDQQIDGIIRRTSSNLSGYNPLDTWVIGQNADIAGDETVPHRDHKCFGVFFYFNEVGGLSTHCVPGQFAGPVAEQKSYPEADKSKAVILPPRSVGLIKLGDITHFGPSEIPPEACRVIMHARYDVF